MLVVHAENVKNMLLHHRHHYGKMPVPSPYHKNCPFNINLHLFLFQIYLTESFGVPHSTFGCPHKESLCHHVAAEILLMLYIIETMFIYFIND